MAEIKHTFTAGKMNKDLDERLVKNGEYRDALNIQVRTSDGDASGAVQNVLGNSKMVDVHNFGLETGDNTAVGGTLDEANDKAYFLFAAPKVDMDFQSYVRGAEYFDLIYQQDSKGEGKYVCIDLFDIIRVSSEFGSPIVDGQFYKLEVPSDSKYRVGMNVVGVNSSNNNLLVPGTRIKAIEPAAGGGSWIIFDRLQDCDASDITHFRLFSRKSYLTLTLRKYFQQLMCWMSSCYGQTTSRNQRK